MCSYMFVYVYVLASLYYFTSRICALYSYDEPATHHHAALRRDFREPSHERSSAPALHVYDGSVQHMTRNGVRERNGFVHFYLPFRF